MTLRPQPLPPVPEATVAAVQAAFPKGNLYVELRAEFGPLYDDHLFTDLYPPSGRPVEVGSLAPLEQKFTLSSNSWENIGF
jgi:hypothetical protein